MIEIKNLVKVYGQNKAVDNISFEVPDGEIMGFLGPNGAGKSTTMNILTGFLSATEGQCLINGIDILEHPIEAKKKIGFLPEIPPLYLEMTVLEYLNFVYDLKKCTLNRKKHIDEICEVIKITDVAHRLIGNLSKGYRQRVGIAQALIGNPEVLIFDEPTVGLDPVQIIEIRNLIRSLGKNHTVILSTHILPEVQAVCDRIVVINKGKIVANASSAEVEKLSEKTDKFRLKVGGNPQEILGILRGVPGIIKAEKLVEETGEADVSCFMIELSRKSEQGEGEIISDKEIRKAVFNSLTNAEMSILSFEPVSLSLEDIFIKLVEGKDVKNEEVKS